MKVVDEAGVALAAEAAMNLVVLQSGTSSGGNSSKTFKDASKAWEENRWANHCLKITSGTGQGQERRIKSNTADTLTLDDSGEDDASKPWTTTPDNTSVYQITEAVYERVYATPAAQAGKTIRGIITAKDDAYPNGDTEEVAVKLRKKP